MAQEGRSAEIYTYDSPSLAYAMNWSVSLFAIMHYVARIDAYAPKGSAGKAKE